MLVLQVVRGGPEGGRLVLPPGDYVVGRAAGCHIRPNSECVSRRHCLLRVGAEALSVLDLGSRNGTLVNGRRVEGCRRLVPGDWLQVGTLVLEVQPTGPAWQCPNCGLVHRGGPAAAGRCPGCQARSGLGLGSRGEGPTIRAAFRLPPPTSPPVVPVPVPVTPVSQTGCRPAPAGSAGRIP